jgi:menaquinone-dependent protoporphyrinogen IX oxidase
MKNCLLAFYSRTGYTRRVAEHIAKRLDCDVCDIQERRPRGGWSGYLRSGFEALTGRLPELQDQRYDPSRYALVVLGTPVWMGQAASPVRAFLAHHPLREARMAVFCSYGGSGAEKALDMLEGIAGKKPVTRLALTDAEIDSGAIARKVEAFVDMLRAALPK